MAYQSLQIIQPLEFLLKTDDVVSGEGHGGDLGQFTTGWVL